MEIAAPADRILEVLLDFDAYPTWAKDLKGVTVESRDDEGRAREVTFRAAAMGRSTSYTLRYDHGPAAPGLGARAGRHHAQARRLLRAGARPAPTDARWSPTTWPSTSSSRCPAS